MSVPKFAIAAVLCAVAAAPLHAQSDEEIVLADPAFSLTFAVLLQARDGTIIGATTDEATRL